MLYFFISLNLKFLLVLIIFGFIMGKARQIALDNFTKKTYGCVVIDFFNLVGTPVHETGHLLFALLFGYHIDKVCFFRRLKKARSSGGTLGYVKMHHNGNSWFQKLMRDFGQFFIGIGPLLFGPAVIFLISFFLPDNLKTLPSAFRGGAESFVKTLHQLTSTDIIVLFVFLYIIIGITLNMELSRQDLQMAYKGLFLLEILFLILSAFAFFFHWNLDNWINILFRWNLMISSIGIICSLMANLIALL